MSLKILFVSRMNADFERWVSLTDYLHDKMEVHMFHAKDLERLENPAMHAVLEECGVEIKTYANFSFFHRIFLFLNTIARAYSSNILWRLGQIFKKIGQRQLKTKLYKYLDKLNPDVLFITPYPEIVESGYEGLCYCHEWFVDNHRHVISADHGSMIYAPKSSLIEINQSIHWHFSSSEICAKRVIGRDLKNSAMNIGDLKNSIAFMSKLKSYYRKICHGRTVALFIPADINVNVKHWHFALQMVGKLLSHEEIDSVIVKAHPNSTYLPFSEALPQDPKVKFIYTEYNSCEICFEADIVISHPSSVLIDALSLGSRVYLVDSTAEWDIIHCYKELNLLALSFSEWLEVENIFDLPFSFNPEALKKFAYNHALHGENRETVYRFLLENCSSQSASLLEDAS